MNACSIEAHRQDTYQNIVEPSTKMSVKKTVDGRKDIRRGVDGRSVESSSNYKDVVNKVIVNSALSLLECNVVCAIKKTLTCVISRKHNFENAANIHRNNMGFFFKSS